ncbi:MAG: metal-dependent transcriptional regulator [Gemmatimonadales bacterium]
MVDPALALIWFAIAVGTLLIFFWPGQGLAIRLLRVLRMTERVRIEDALKHAYNEEYANRTASIHSMAGALEVSRAFAVRLVTRLEARELVHSSDEGLQLTAAGRDYALRILRTHRLWERYLADRTNVKPTDWHDEAERREHRLAATEVDALAASMGHPVYDPHGDPIPTDFTVHPLPTERAVGPYEKLSSLSPGESAVVVQIAHACQGPQRRRLLDLGVVPGTVITAELQGALSDPMAYRIRSALIALRQQQADLIYVERDPSKGGN